MAAATVAGAGDFDLPAALARVVVEVVVVVVGAADFAPVAAAAADAFWRVRALCCWRLFAPVAPRSTPSTPVAGDKDDETSLDPVRVDFARPFGDAAAAGALLLALESSSAELDFVLRRERARRLGADWFAPDLAAESLT